MSTKLTEHFTLEEATKTSQKGIINKPSADVIKVILSTAAGMEKVREILGNNPILVSSWYRCPQLNAKIGGSSKSQHMKGEAVDFTCPDFGTAFEVCKELEKQKLHLRFDQLIYEQTWVHISFLIPSVIPRFECLTYTKDKKYIPGIVFNS